MATFKIGDKVILHKDWPKEVGTIIAISLPTIHNSNKVYHIKYPKAKLGRHTCDERTLKGCGWNALDSWLTLVEHGAPPEKYAEVISKIKSMRQKRKEMGYVF